MNYTYISKYGSIYKHKITTRNNHKEEEDPTHIKWREEEKAQKQVEGWRTKPIIGFTNRKEDQGQPRKEIIQSLPSWFDFLKRVSLCQTTHTTPRDFFLGINKILLKW